jgi:hypothetical protein
MRHRFHRLLANVRLRLRRAGFARPAGPVLAHGEGEGGVIMSDPRTLERPAAEGAAIAERDFPRFSPEVLAALEAAGGIWRTRYGLGLTAQGRHFVRSGALAPRRAAAARRPWEGR